MLILVCVHPRSSSPVNDPKDVSSYRHLGPRHDIRGFRFDSNYEGRKVLSIKADRFSIQKKKLGFFRFGLMNEARLENALVRIYGKAGKGEAAASQDLTFDDAFLGETIPSFSVKRVSSVVLEPINVELHNDDSVVTRISAASAAIRLAKRDILFKGGVKVVSGSRVLKTDQLSIEPENALMKTDRHFILESPEEKWEGQKLTTDLFLRFITQQERNTEF